jgi:hypothetical protein
MRTQEPAMKLRSVHLVSLGAGLVVSACGSLSGNTSQHPVLTTLHGELSNPQSLSFDSSASATHVAVIWLGMNEGYSIAEDLPVLPVFPSQFKLEIRDPPPAEAMITAAASQAGGGQAPPQGDPVPSQGPSSGPAPSPAPAPSSGPTASPTPSAPPDFALAVGSVVAYEDLNGNGKLDLVDEGATSYVDRILGANPGLVLVYIQGTLTPGTDFANLLRDDSGSLPQPGFNLFHSAQGTDKSAWLSMDTLYELPLTGDPRFASMMCRNGLGFSTAPASPSPGQPPLSDAGLDAALDDAEIDAAVPPDPPLPSPNDPNLKCAPDGRSFTDCAPPAPPPQPTLCAPQQVGLECGSIPAPTPLPPNWPCPVH